jgi:ribosomal protein L40E
MGCSGVDCIQGRVRGSCEHGNESSVCIKCGVLTMWKAVICSWKCGVT